MGNSVIFRKDAAFWSGVHATASEKLDELRAERDELEAKQESLSREIVRLERLVASLEPFTVEQEMLLVVTPTVEGIEGLGLAEACRAVLKGSTSYRTARGIRDSLANSGYNLDQHSNPLASIHGVLKRLVQSGEVEQLESDGKTRYRWKERIVPEKQLDIIEALKKSLQASARRPTPKQQRLEKERRARKGHAQGLRSMADALEEPEEESDDLTQKVKEIFG